jgi:hypothetical protein
MADAEFSEAPGPQKAAILTLAMGKERARKMFAKKGR